MQLDFGETHLAPKVDTFAGPAPGSDTMAGLAPDFDTVAGPILLWAADWHVGDAIESRLVGAGHRVHRLADDAALATAHTREALLVGQCGPRLEAQQAFLRGPLILVEAGRKPSTALGARAYAVVGEASEIAYAVDRFVEHRLLARQVAERRGPPRRCSRCGRGFDALKARRAGTARRFVRFGTIALCGTCVEALRTLLRQAQTQVAVVEADT